MFILIGCLFVNYNALQVYLGGKSLVLNLIPLFSVLFQINLSSTRFFCCLFFFCLYKDYFVQVLEFDFVHHDPTKTSFKLQIQGIVWS